MKKVLILMLFLMVSGTVSLIAQVTIGAEKQPEKGALLELNEHLPLANSSTADKGMLFPRVWLTSHNNLFPMFDSSDGTNYLKGGTPYLKSVQDASHTGLVVYNVCDSIFSEGLHFWSGEEWRRLNGNSPAPAKIDSLVCSSANVVPNRLRTGVPFEAIMKVTYLNGNGGSYPSTLPDPTIIGHGLSIERFGGTLAIGQGEVSYHIFGTPIGLAADSTITFDNDLEFLGKTYCEKIVIGQDMEIKTMQFMRKTVPLNANTTTESEMLFGNLKVRCRYNPTLNLIIPEIRASMDTRALVWFRKTGSGGGAMGSSNIYYSYYMQIPLTVSGSWKNLLNSTNTAAGDPGASGLISGLTPDNSNVGYTQYALSSNYRDIADAIIVFQNNTVREIYRLTFNVHNDISPITSEGTVIPLVEGSCTVFLEKLD